MAKKQLTIEEKLEAALVPVEEQLYKVPENWCWTRLGNVAQWGSGGTPSRKNPSFYEGDIPWIKTGELNEEYIYDTEEHISKEALEKSSAKIFPVNTVVLAMYGATIGKVGILGVPATTNQACACGVCSKGIKFAFLAKFLQSQKQSFIMKGKGGAQPNISQQIIKNHPIALPPLAEQSRIVACIESLFAKLDEAKEKIQEVLDGADLRRAAILHQAFTGKLTEKWRRENGVSDESWEIKTIGELCTVVRGGSPRPAGDERYYNGDIPFMKVADITRNNGPYVNTTEHTIKEAGLGKTRMVEANTLLLTNSGATLGVPAICTIRTTFNDGIAAFLDLEPNDIKFFYYFWTTMTHQLRNINQGAAQPNLNTDIIKSISLKVPTIFEQQEIVHLLDNLLTREQSIVTACEEALTTIDTLKKSILARAFRGELGTNDPTESSAKELLQEILAS